MEVIKFNFNSKNMMNMNILHIVAGPLHEGAARGAYWLHLGLRHHGIKSQIMTDSRDNLGDTNVLSISSTKKLYFQSLLRSQIDNLPTVLYRNREKIIFSTGIFGFDFTKTKEYEEADIIHLHWINGGFVNIKHLSKVNKPIVWTMRDMWPITGGCHYSMGCEKYKTGCGKCNQLNSSFKYDLSSIVVKRKHKYIPKNTEIVGISNWLSEKAKDSYLFRDFKIRTIHNCINTTEFAPIDKEIAREILGLSTDKKIILAGAQSITDFYKGFDKYIEAISLLDKKQYYLCFFGRLDRKYIDQLEFEYMNFGFLFDTVSLRLLYSAADVFVAPSLMDAFGKTLAESMACGTPVVCFNATGPKDIVDHKINGYKAVPFDSTDLSNGIIWVLNSPNYQSLSLNAREKVLRCFDSKVVARQYIELYQSVMK